MTLFVSALPASTTLALINNHFEIRGDAHKLLTSLRRPIPQGAQDIGSWQVIYQIKCFHIAIKWFNRQDIFELMTTIAVITNAAIIIFTMSIFNDKPLTLRFWLFVGFQWTVFILQYVLRAIIPDIPSEVTIQLERADLFESKFIFFTQDTDEATLKTRRVKHDIRQLTILEEGPKQL